MLYLFEKYANLFQSWEIIQYEQEGGAYMLRVSAVLEDGSRLKIRDYLFADGQRKYVYQWMDADGTLRRRWDNAPHWPDIATTPHHVHLAGQAQPEPSIITNLEDLFQFLHDWLQLPTDSSD
ncbi:MAG: hypothetical protein HF973_16165 [Chloroflexi bacterium]|nr:hypothetical protein [Chloroflexota bacterium]